MNPLQAILTCFFALWEILAAAIINFEVIDLPDNNALSKQTYIIGGLLMGILLLITAFLIYKGFILALYFAIFICSLGTIAMIHGQFNRDYGITGVFLTGFRFAIFGQLATSIKYFKKTKN